MAAFPAPKRDFSRFSFESYTDESMLDDIRRLVQADLSEPYSVWVYRYFIHGWPEHCTCVYTIPSSAQSTSDNTTTVAGGEQLNREVTCTKREMIGVIVSKAEEEQGASSIIYIYIALLCMRVCLRVPVSAFRHTLTHTHPLSHTRTPSIGVKKGYLAMLAVNKAYRGHGLGMELAQRGIRSMVTAGCTEIMLEAEYNNKVWCVCLSASLPLHLFFSLTLTSFPPLPLPPPPLGGISAV